MYSHWDSHFYGKFSHSGPKKPQAILPSAVCSSCLLRLLLPVIYLDYLLENAAISDELFFEINPTDVLDDIYFWQDRATCEKITSLPENF